MGQFIRTAALLMSLLAIPCLAFGSQCNDGIDNDGDGSCDRLYGACVDPDIFGGDAGCDSDEDDDESLPNKIKVVRMRRISHPAFTTANIGSSGNRDWQVWNLDNTKISLYESRTDCIRYKEKLGKLCNYVGSDGFGWGRRAVWANISDLKEFDEDTPLQEYYGVFKPIPYMDHSSSGYPTWSPFEGEKDIVYTAIKNNSTKYPQFAGHVVKINVVTGQARSIVPLDAINGRTVCLGWSASKKLYCSHNGETDWSDSYIVDVQNKTKTKIIGGRPVFHELENFCDPRWDEWPEVGHGHGGLSPDRTMRAHDYGHANENGVYYLNSCDSVADIPDFVEDMAWEESAIDKKHNGIARPIYPHAPSHVSWKASNDWFIVDTYQQGVAIHPERQEQRVMQVLFDGEKFKYNTLSKHQTQRQWDDGFRFFNPTSPTCMPIPGSSREHVTGVACTNSDSNYPYCDVTSHKCYNTCIPLLVKGIVKNSQPGGEHCAMNMSSTILPVLRKDGAQILISSTEGKYSYDDWRLCARKQGTPYACPNFKQIDKNWGTSNYYLIDLEPVAKEVAEKETEQVSVISDDAENIESDASESQDIATPSMSGGGCELMK